MTKQKTKLVCVGWAIWDIEDKCLWLIGVGRRGWTRRKDAIKAWDDYYGEDSYQWSRQRGLAIAKKLRVEVKDDG